MTDKAKGGWISLGMFFMIIACLNLLFSCTAIADAYRDYDPQYVRIEHRYNNSWGFYRHAYYRPVNYDWRWTYRPIITQPYCPPTPTRKIVKSKTRRGNSSSNKGRRGSSNKGRRQ